MKKWKGLKGWQKGVAIGFSIFGVTHLIAITFILLIDGAKGVAGLAFFMIEFSFIRIALPRFRFIAQERVLSTI